MNVLTPLNMDSFYAHKKVWQLNTWFFIPARVTQLNALITKINTALDTPPSAAHAGLYHRFSSAYFWQNMAVHPGYAEARALWENTHLLVYTNNQTLVWFIDYAFPSFEEYLNEGLKECLRLQTQTQQSVWQPYLPDYDAYLHGIEQIRTQLITLQSALMQLKTQLCHTIQVKLSAEQHNDLLKCIARKLNVACEFESTETISNNALVFLRATLSPAESVNTLNRMLDKNPPLLSAQEAQQTWITLSRRLRALKRKYRFSPPKQPSIAPTPWFTWATLHQAKLYVIQQTIRYASLPILVWLFFTGWLSIPTFAISITLCLSYPWLHKMSAKILTKLQQFDTFLPPYSGAFFRAFLIERTEYIETIERSALWRKNRLLPGCHHVDSLDLDLLVPTYEAFQATLSQQKAELEAIRPPFWQLWRRETTHLINTLLSELTLEQTTLTSTMQLYARDIVKRLNTPLFSPPIPSLNPLRVFVARFAPDALPELNTEDQAIRYFLSCLCEEEASPILFKRPLITQARFATHCCDVAAINHVLDQISPFLSHPAKKQALLELGKLLKQEKCISPEQVANHLDLLSTPLYPKEKIGTVLQTFLFTTFTGTSPATMALFGPQQHHLLATWLEAQKNDLTQAQSYFDLILTWPDNQDWGNLADDFVIIAPEKLDYYLTLVELHEARQLHLMPDNQFHSMRTRLKAKLDYLTPNYTGAPSNINQWMEILWQQHCPIRQEERILHARFSWTLNHIATKKQLTALPPFIQDATLLYPRADNNHRLSRAFVNHPHFYSPWNEPIQQAVEELENNHLLLPAARAAYKQKALQCLLRMR